MPAGQAAPVPSHRPFQVTWSFDLRYDRFSIPHCNVFLRVNGKRFPVLRGTTSEFHVVGRQEYKDHDVPPQAITACTGWFGGQGNELYVVRRGEKLIVFDRALDEQEDVPPYKYLRTIPLR